MIKTTLLSLVFLATVTVDRSKVRFGDVDAFLKSQNGNVGVIESQKVYKVIPAYNKINLEKVKKDSARWFELMSKATKEYKKCIREVAKSQNLSLVVELGGIQNYKVVNITDLCIKRVKTITLSLYPKSQKSKDIYPKSQK